MTPSAAEKLRVMLIDESSQRSDDLIDMLGAVDCEVIAKLSTEQDLLREVETLQPDMIIIDIELPDRDTLENLRNVQSVTPRPMVMFSQDDDGATIRRAVQSGVSAYVVDGIQPRRVRPVLDAAIATFEQHQKLSRQLTETRQQLLQRKSIERAKGILMKQRGISEAEAYRLLQKSAMDNKQKLIDVAEQIISAAELLAVES